ncbi:MAG: methyltransferase family protein [Candidatus Odinarchaeota archaeon]
MGLIQKIKKFLLEISGYLILLVQQIPALGVYVGVMTLPLFIFLVLLFSQLPPTFIIELAGFFLVSFMSLGGIIANILVIGGLFLAIYSIVYLHRHKNEGLVTTGPYQYMRHPQYTGFLLFSLGLTGLSCWYLSITFGMGWLPAEATILLWFGQFAAYIILALLEDFHLAKEFGETFTTYKSQVPSLIPFGRTGRLDIPLSIGIFSLLVLSAIMLQMIGISGPTFG